MHYVGIDVDSVALVVARHDQGAPERFANTPAGHRALVRWLHRQEPVRVCLEATGTYSLDVARALHAASGVEVMVINPRASKSFADALLTRSRDDAGDAVRLARFAAAMPFVPWTPPSPAALALRQIAREATTLGDEVTAAKNRRHAVSQTRLAPKTLLRAMDRHIREIQARIAELERAALDMVHDDAGLADDLALIITITGFAERSALRVLGELAARFGPLEPRQIVAYAGLDVVRHISGTSVDRKPHISKRGNANLRRALYMPALVAIRYDPAVGAFYRRLIAKGLEPLQAIAAVMRKLLHAISAVLRHRTPYDPQKLFKQPIPA